VSRYEALLTLHVIAAIVWLGAGAALGLIAFRVERSLDGDELRLLTRLDKWLTPRLFIPSSLAVLVFGIALVLGGPWSFGQLWILIGLGGYAASFLIGLLVLEPAGKRLHAALEEQGPEAPETRSRLRRLLLVSRIELAILFLVVADMVAKPRLDQPWTLAAGAALLAAAVAGAFLLAQGEPVPDEAAPAVEA
jgi:uncharacterized membrane protein